MDPDSRHPYRLALTDALREGDRDRVVALMQAATPSERSSVAALVRRHDALVSALPGGSVATDGEWRGRLTSAHWSAAAAAQLACLPPERAARYWPLDLRDRIDLPPALHPDDLDVFVHEWSARLVRSPKD